MGSNSDYIRFAVKSAITNCIKVAIVRSKLDHIRFAVITTITSDNKVTITKTNNPSINNCTIVNRGIKRPTTNFVYNRKLDNSSI
jgi:hypothetical protein